jgi:hypothetical protein
MHQFLCSQARTLAGWRLETQLTVAISSQSSSTLVSRCSLNSPLRKSKLMLQATVSPPVCLGVEHPSVACDQTFIAVRQLRVY